MHAGMLYEHLRVIYISICSVFNQMSVLPKLDALVVLILTTRGHKILHPGSISVKMAEQTTSKRALLFPVCLSVCLYVSVSRQPADINCFNHACFYESTSTTDV